jgi:hypothetical protein
LAIPGTLPEKQSHPSCNYYTHSIPSGADQQRPSRASNDQQRPATTSNDQQRPATTSNDQPRPAPTKIPRHRANAGCINGAAKGHDFSRAAKAAENSGL